MENRVDAADPAPDLPVAAVRYHCPLCRCPLADATKQACTGCDREVAPAVIRAGDWKADHETGTFLLLRFGSEYLTALAIVSVFAWMLHRPGEDLGRFLFWLWLGFPLLLIAGEITRASWSKEFLPHYALPLAVVAFIAGAAAFAFGSRAGLAGAAPLVVTLFLPKAIYHRWESLEPFRSLRHAIVANLNAQLLAALVMLVPVWLVAAMTRG